MTQRSACPSRGDGGPCKAGNPEDPSLCRYCGGDLPENPAYKDLVLAGYEAFQAIAKAKHELDLATIRLTEQEEDRSLPSALRASVRKAREAVNAANEKADAAVRALGDLAVEIQG